MEEKTLNEKESLELITRMIRNTQDRFERGAGKPFIVFGYLTLAASLVVWYLMKTTGNPQWNWLWFAIPLIGGSLMYFSSSKKPKKVVTFIDRAVHQVWLTLGICAILIALYVSFSSLAFPILMTISLLMFIGEAITGSIIKLGYVKMMGWIGIFLSFGLPFLTGADQILGFGALFLVAMIIPGHIMNAQASRIARENTSEIHV